MQPKEPQTQPNPDDDSAPFGARDADLVDVPEERHDKLPGREDRQVPEKKDRFPGADEQLRS